YLGGSGNEAGNAIARLPNGDIALTGSTASSNFPTQVAFQSSNAGSTDVFASVIASDGGSLRRSSYIGGSVADSGNGIASDSNASLYLAGTTYSTNFPTANAYQS